MTTAFTERRLTDEERYRRKVAAIVAGLDKTTTRQARAALALLADMHQAIVSAAIRLPTTNGAWAAMYLGALRTVIDQAVSEFERRWLLLIDTAMTGAYHAGSADTYQLARMLPGMADAVFPMRESLAVFTGARSLAFDAVRRVAADVHGRLTRIVTVAVATGQAATRALRQIAGVTQVKPTPEQPAGSPIAVQVARVVDVEVSGAYHAGVDTARAAVLPEIPQVRKMWQTMRDHRVRPAHVTAGRQYAPGGTPGPIPAGTEFVVGGEACTGPHDPRLSYANRVNCRCYSALWHPEWGR